MSIVDPTICSLGSTFCFVILEKETGRKGDLGKNGTKK